MEATIRIGNVNYQKSDVGFSRALASAYANKLRPRCVCRAGGVPMYIAKLGTHYVLKRMPNSGGGHNVDCESYEAPVQLSGFGEVLGRAVQEDPETGTTLLKLDFALSKQGKRGPLAGSGDSEADSVKADGNKLSFRGLLHFLWAQAQFDRWVPAMAGKRSWHTLRKHILSAAADKKAKGMSLLDVLFMPEMFVLDHKDDIERRKKQQFAKILDTRNRGTESLMLLIGELKEFAPARYSQKMVIKHLAHDPIMLSEDIHKRLNKAFSAELALWDYLDRDAHLVVIATVSRTQAGFLNAEQLALMVTNSDWLPIENMPEHQLLKTLIDQKRRFIKGLRVNMGRTKPMASALLTDVGEQPTALYISGGEFDKSDLENPLAALIAQSNLPAWVWNATEDTTPPLPAAVKRQASIDSSKQESNHSQQKADLS